MFGRVSGNDPFYGTVVARWVVDADGSDLRQLTRGDSGAPSWAPDGGHVAFTQRQSDGTWQIATMAADGSGVRVLTTGFGSDNAAWAPDGTWIAFGKAMTDPNDPHFHTTIWRMDADGSHPQPLGDQTAFDVEPKVSPDGRMVMFERLTFPGGSQRQALVIRTIATGAERVVASVGTAVEHAAWSPDGTTIVYDVSSALGARIPTDQVERIASDGSGRPTVLFASTDGTAGFKPSYSPDGSRIVFGCKRPANPRESVCVMDADGTNLTVLLTDPSVNDQHVQLGRHSGLPVDARGPDAGHAAGGARWAS